MYLNQNNIFINIVSLDDFKFYYKIGKGKFGYVHKVKEKITGRYYALKQMTKAKIIDIGLETVVLRERNILAKLNSSFVVSMLCAFQNKNNLFTVMELLPGGDLQFHMTHYDYYLTESQLKFLFSNLIFGLEYIHKKEIIHCNLRPDNIMLDSKGFTRIIGFCYSCEKNTVMDEKILKVEKSVYMAPEVINKEEIDYSADFYSLGALGYKLISGKEYDSEEGDKDLTKDKKLKHRYSEMCLDFISLLLKSDKEERLGSKELEKELKEHEFFIGMKWDLIKKKFYLSPLIDMMRFSRINTEYPEIFDYDLCNNTEEKLTPQQIQDYTEIIESKSYPMYFQYYTCMKVDNIMRELNKKDNTGKDDFFYLAKDKKMNKSQSSKQLTSKESSKHHHHHVHGPRESFENIYELPYISNKAEKQRKKREKIIKNYYESKLLKYKNYIKKLQRENQFNYLQPQYISKNDYYYQKYMKYFPPQFMKKVPNGYNYYDPSYYKNYLPKIKPQKSITKESELFSNKEKPMYKIMNKFYDQMNKDRDNFFVKFNENNNFNKKNDKSYDDYSSSYSSEHERKFKKKIHDVPYYDPMYPNVYYHNYFDNGGMDNRRIKSGSSNVKEFSIEKSEESEDSDSSTSSRRYTNGRNNDVRTTSSLANMMGPFGNYYQPRIGDIRGYEEESGEEEESEEEEEESKY